jgi:hypothetical protein
MKDLIKTSGGKYIAPQRAHIADDTLARYETVPPAARRIPGARLLTIERGGHLLLGAEDRVRAEIAGFVRSHAQVVEPVETARRP